MKQYCIDEIRPDDYGRLKAALERRFTASPIEGIYSYHIEAPYLTPTQREHDQCGPHYCAMELTESSLSVEFLVRSSQRMRCGCMAYAGDDLKLALIKQIDALFETLDIVT